MNEPHQWRTAQVTPLHDCRIFELQQVEAINAAGEVRPFVRIHSGDWINVIPITDDGHIVMVRQFRHGSSTTTLEIPGGMVDPGESAETAARRELLEETGFEAPSFEFVGAINPNPALFDNKLHTFIARGATRVGDVCNEGDEETVVELVPTARVPQLVREGQIDHCLVLSALYLEQLATEKHPD